MAASLHLRALVVLLLLSSVLAAGDPKRKKKDTPDQQRDVDSQKPAGSAGSDEKITLKFRAFMTNRDDFKINGRLYKFMKSPHPLKIAKSAEFGELLRMIASEDFGGDNYSQADVERYRLIFRGGVMRAVDGLTINDYGLRDGDEIIIRLHNEQDKAGFWKKLAMKTLLGVISYGKFCGPSHGEVDSLQVPEDALDSACRKHDHCWSYTSFNDCICNRKAAVDFESASFSCPKDAINKCKLMSKYGGKYFGSTKCQCLGTTDDRKTFYNGFPVSSPHECGATTHPLFPLDQISRANGFVDRALLHEKALKFEIPEYKLKQWKLRSPDEKDASPRDK